MDLEFVVTPPSVKFPEGNKLECYQDFRFFLGLPTDVNLFVWDETPSHFTLVGDRYGVLERHEAKGIKGAYGNGSISLNKKNLTPDLITKLRGVCINNEEVTISEDQSAIALELLKDVYNLLGDIHGSEYEVYEQIRVFLKEVKSNQNV